MAVVIACLVLSHSCTTLLSLFKFHFRVLMIPSDEPPNKARDDECTAALHSGMALKRDVQKYERGLELRKMGRNTGNLARSQPCTITKDSQLNLERIMMTDLDYSDADLEKGSDQVRWDGACT